MFQTTLEELCAFLGINILMGIHKLPKMRDYWSVDEGLGNTLIQKTMTRDRFLEILQNLHFVDNLQKPAPKESESFDQAWKEPIKWGFKFWFWCASKPGYLYQFDMYLRKKPKTEFGLGESVVLSLCENLKNSYCYVFFDNLFGSPNLMLKLFEDGIYATGTVRSNWKLMPTLKDNKQMKRGEHDWLACDTISATKWMDNRSVILLSNYHNPSVVQEINRRVKGSKEKMKVSCPTVIREYNMYMGGVDLCDQVKVSYEVDRRSKVRFYL